MPREPDPIYVVRWDSPHLSWSPCGSFGVSTKETDPISSLSGGHLMQFAQSGQFNKVHYVSIEYARRLIFVGKSILDT